MKKIIAIAFTAFSLAACNTTETDKSTSTTIDTTGVDTTTTTTYSAVEGDITYRDKKVRVMKKGEWVDADKDITLDNGVIVGRDGRVKKEGKEVELKDGEIVNRTGRFFDQTGRAIEDAWEVTKDGAKDAGHAIKKTAEKLGERVNDAVDGNRKNKKDSSR